jgi:hypothetical protein
MGKRIINGFLSNDFHGRMKLEKVLLTNLN